MSNRVNGIIALVFRALRVVLPLERARGRPSNRLVSRRHPGFALFALVVCTPTATAQQVFPPGTFSIDGFAVNCGSAVTIVTPNIPDIAAALPGQILLHPMLATLPTGVKLFVYAHECAHQFVGPDEVAADAWAIKLGRNQGWINPFVLNQVCRSVWFSPGSWTHFPGPQRCHSMMQAYYSP